MTIVNQKALEEKLQQTAAVAPEIILGQIREFLLSAKDAELLSINPYRFAVARKLNRLETLKTFLSLTKKGLFNLSWTIHCPSCKGATQQAEHLVSLKHADRCPFCKIDFSAGFDKSLEVSFAVNPAIIRPGEVSPYDRIAASLETEPGISIELDPGESHFVAMELKKGNLLVVIPEDQKTFNIAVMEEKAAGTQKIVLAHRDELGPLTVERAEAGIAEVVIVNGTPRKKSMLMARMMPQRWPSAAVVSSLQEFRDLFSAEMLSLDETFSIESLSFLFTDIKGSTELYERLGDAQAFALVKEHFAIMERIVRANNGGIVKTIGDAVMAVFVDPRDALHGAGEMIDSFDDLETARKLKNSIIIKVGIHHGPCIAVTLNDRLDYFGTTVNMAARVQGLSDGRDIMASQALIEGSDGVAWLADNTWAHESFVTSLKGLTASHQVHKLFRTKA